MFIFKNCFYNNNLLFIFYLDWCHLFVFLWATWIKENHSIVRIFILLKYLVAAAADVTISPWTGMMAVTCSSTLPLILSHTKTLPSTNNESLLNLYWLWGYLSITRNMNRWSSHHACRFCLDISSVTWLGIEKLTLDTFGACYWSVISNVELSLSCYPINLNIAPSVSD